MSRGASGGVSVRAGPSPELKSRRVRARRERARGRFEDDVVRSTGALLCSECGFLAWPDAGTASPHRTSGDAQHQAECAHCRSRAWIDLRRESTALVIREGEQEVAAAESASVDTLRKAGMGFIVGAFVGILATSSLVAGLCIALFAGAAGGLAAVRLQRLSVPPVRTLPDRWSLALPPATPPTTTVEGVPVPVEILRSPLTGRPCVAFEVGLRSDSNTSGELSSWALLEQRVASMTLDGTSIDPKATFVELSRELLGELSPETLEPPAVEWMLERGFSPIGSTLIVYESVVSPRTPVSLTTSDDGAVLRALQKSLRQPGTRPQQNEVTRT